MEIGNFFIVVPANGVRAEFILGPRKARTRGSGPRTGSGRDHLSAAAKFAGCTKALPIMLAAQNDRPGPPLPPQLGQEEFRARYHDQLWNLTDATSKLPAISI